MKYNCMIIWGWEDQGYQLWHKEVVEIEDEPKPENVSARDFGQYISEQALQKFRMDKSWWKNEPVFIFVKSILVQQDPPGTPDYIYQR